jgi:uncharacterized protein YecT (DUF1311 family)
MTLRTFVIAACAAALALIAVDAGLAQDRKPTKKEVDAIRACAKKNADDAFEAERRCLFNLVATPCTKRPEGQSNQGTAACYGVEQAIWDELLNQNFNKLREGLDEEQKTKAREMQRAWIVYRDTTCSFYYDKIQGTMAVPMTAACLARETARRALLLAFFETL